MGRRRLLPRPLARELLTTTRVVLLTRHTHSNEISADSHPLIDSSKTSGGDMTQTRKMTKQDFFNKFTEREAGLGMKRSVVVIVRFMYKIRNTVKERSGL